MYCYVIWYLQYNKFFLELSGKMEVLLMSIQMIELLLPQFSTSNIYYHINVLTNLCRGTFLFLWLYDVKIVLVDQSLLVFCWISSLSLSIIKKTTTNISAGKFCIAFYLRYFANYYINIILVFKLYKYYWRFCFQH